MLSDSLNIVSSDASTVVVGDIIIAGGGGVPLTSFFTGGGGPIFFFSPLTGGDSCWLYEEFGPLLFAANVMAGFDTKLFTGSGGTGFTGTLLGDS